jgi:hypothetical protein
MADATQSSLAGTAPRRFGKYWLDAQLAEGGMSRVLLARLRGPGGFEKRLVVKQILPQLAQDPGFIELFVREANTLVQMSHPNIVPVYELGVVEGVYFLAMELVEGSTVAELVHDGPLPEAMCAHIGAQICEALRYAHERFGLVHRDVTPRNVIIDASGHVRLLDFGIAAPLAHTGRGELFGSPGYMSPEQARGETLGPQSDLFSLGTVLYEALTGKRAVASAEPGAAAQASTERVERSLAPNFGELGELVDALLAADPAQRPASAAEAATRFRTWLSQKHPEGVAFELGRRAELARARAARPVDEAPQQPQSEDNATPRLTRSIATSRQLTELLSVGTEPLGREERAARSVRRGATPLRWVVVAVCGLLAAALLLQRQPGVGRRAARGLGHAGRPPAAPSSPQAQPQLTQQPSAATAGAIAPAQPAPPALEPDATKAPPPPQPSALAARAHLSVNALPWAELLLDGHPVGATPQRDLSVATGNHVLQLNCPPLGRSARVPLKLDAGDHRRVLVDLNSDPPRVTSE